MFIHTNDLSSGLPQSAGQSMKDAAPSEPTIEVSHISKAFRVYGDKSHTFKDRVLFRERSRHTMNQVLKDVSFTVGRGEALGLIGHNGSGKSTTLKLLNRIIYPDSGTIRMHGRISSLIELGAGFHPDMSGRENIYINASIFGLKRHEIDKRLNDIIRFSELEEYIDNPVRTYSSGMYMRLAFAIAINVDADILLIDEILAVGDANFQKKCFDKLAEIKTNGATIVIVSHSMDQIKSICDRVIWLEKGEVKADGEATDVCQQYLVIMQDKANARKRAEEKARGLQVGEDPNIAWPIRDICSQYGIYSRRSGNMRTRFTEVTLKNADGELTTEFENGEDIVVSFGLQVYEHQDDQDTYNIIFNIFHAGGTLCSSFSSFDKTGRFFDADEMNSKKQSLVLSHIPFADGTYILDAVVADRNGEAYDCLGHLIEFSVRTPKEKGVGILSIENEWREEKETTA